MGPVASVATDPSVRRSAGRQPGPRRPGPGAAQPPGRRHRTSAGLRRPGVDARRQDRRLRPAQPLRQRGTAAEDKAANACQAQPQAPPRVPGYSLWWSVPMWHLQITVAPARLSGTAWPRLGGRAAPPRLPGTAGTPAPRRGKGGPVQRRQLLGPQRAAIAWLALQRVMKALGHPKNSAEPRSTIHRTSIPAPFQYGSSVQAAAQLHHPKRWSSPSTPSVRPAAHRHAAGPRARAASSVAAGSGRDPRNAGSQAESRQEPPRSGRSSTRIRSSVRHQVAPAQRPCWLAHRQGTSVRSGHNGRASKVQGNVSPPGRLRPIFSPCKQGRSSDSGPGCHALSALRHAHGPVFLATTRAARPELGPQGRARAVGL